MPGLRDDHDACVRAVRARDARFDGWFVTAVTSTRIYCRPSCPATPPRPEHLRFYATAAAAQAAGFRACKRCRPDASPGAPEWQQRGDAVARAVRMIADGVVDREGVPGLARRLGYSTRQVERLLVAELGAGPLALARAQRAQAARVLIETTDLPMAQVAFAAGFGSVRSFNDTVAATFATTPRQLRSGAGAPAPSGPGWLALRLAHRPPLWAASLFGHLAATAVPGIESWTGGAYWRTLRLPHGAGVVALRPAGTHVAAEVRLDALRDLPVAIARVRRLLDLDADPEAVDAALGADPALAPLVAAAPGRRVPGSVDGAELALRAVLGQQVSTAAARTHAARLVSAQGTPLADPTGGLTHLWPEPGAIAGADPATLGLPGRRRATLLRLAASLDGGLDLSPGADRDRARAALAALPGIGPWTVETVAMRALGDPDALPATDLGVLAAAGRLGLPVRPGDLARRARCWSPWRSYATQHLWGALDHPINHPPQEAQP